MTAPAPPRLATPGTIGDPARAAPRPLVDVSRALATGARLGWAIESNWSDPLLFAIYSIIKPLGAALILVAIVWAISGGGQPGAIAFLIVGSACWAFVGGGILGLVGAILDDRERYRMLKYVVVSQAPFPAFLVGRSAAQLVMATVGFLVTIGVGVVVPGRPDRPLGRSNWALLAVSMAVGLVGVMAIGIAMAGFCLQLRQEAWSLSGGHRGRRSISSPARSSRSTSCPVRSRRRPRAAHDLVAGGDPAGPARGRRRRACWRASTTRCVLLALLATTGVLTLAGWAVFRFFERRARERGLLDQTTGS